MPFQIITARSTTFRLSLIFIMISTIGQCIEYSMDRSLRALLLYMQGSTLRKNFISPAGLVIVTFTIPAIFFASPDDKSFQIHVVISVDNIASVDNMKRIHCIVVN